MKFYSEAQDKRQVIADSLSDIRLGMQDNSLLQRVVLYIAGHLTAPLASTQYRLVASFPNCDNL